MMFSVSPRLCLSLLPGMNLIVLSVHVGFITKKSQGFSSFPSDCFLFRGVGKLPQDFDHKNFHSVERMLILNS